MGMRAVNTARLRGVLGFKVSREFHARSTRTNECLATWLGELTSLQMSGRMNSGIERGPAEFVIGLPVSGEWAGSGVRI
jgi:hypothetical protein